jgi:L-ascorbate metabolism protein UlaG (beta-lactamase superfamily)
MKITKYNHSCMLIEEHNTRILTDPGGTYFSIPELEKIDMILITHEHPDHYDMEAIKKILNRSPAARIYTNKGVGAQLDKARIKHNLLEDGGSVTDSGIKIEAFGSVHATILSGLPQVANTGYMISGRFFHPGDAFTVPPNGVEVLALPIAAPWQRLAEAVDYVIKVKPKLCFPVHEALLKELFGMRVIQMPKKEVENAGIKYNVIEPGKSIEL